MIILKKAISRTVVKILGWKFQGDMPHDIDKLVMIGAPHTSNWDFFVMLSCAWHYGLQVKWLGKESLFSNFFMRNLCKLLGGVKVQRGHSEKAVDKIAETIRVNKNRICLVIAPEGTRSKKAGWRSGFYYIAKSAQIPIGLGFADYTKKIMGVGPILRDHTSIDDTMAAIKKFYENHKGKHPKLQSPVKIVKSST